MDGLTKNYLVVGLGKSGTGVIRFLLKKGMNVRGSDISPIENLSEEVSSLIDEGTEIELENHSDEFLEWCDEIILSPGVSVNTDYILRATQEGKSVISEIELASRYFRKPVIAVTGTNGKTTTTEIIGNILKNSGFNVFVGGNIGTPFITAVSDTGRYDYAVLEVSSFQLQSVDTFRPYISVFLNITPNHLDHHLDFEEYLASKINIFKNQTSDDWAIINSEDPCMDRYIPQIKANKILFAPGSELLRLRENSVVFRGEEYNLEGMKLLGKHNLQNAAFAVAAAALLGCGRKTIEDSITGFKPLPHRIEYLGNHRGINVFNDSKSTSPGATLRAIESINEPIILLAGGKDKGTDYKVLEKSINKKVKHLILFGEAKNRINEQIGGCVMTTIADDLEEAVKTAFLHSAENDSLLFSPACSSFDMFSSYEERGEEFKKIVEFL